MTRDWTDEEIDEINETMAAGALGAIQKLLDDGGIPRGTFADDQVCNLVALYNRRGWALQWIWENCGEFALPDWVKDAMPDLTKPIPPEVQSQ